jgi:hypothetical protein
LKTLVKRDIDKRLAVELRSQLLNQASPALKKETFERLARWCKTDGIYADGMDVANVLARFYSGGLSIGRVLEHKGNAVTGGTSLNCQA